MRTISQAEIELECLQIALGKKPAQAPMKIKPLEPGSLAMWLKEDYVLYAAHSSITNPIVRLYANHYGELRVTRGPEILFEGTSMQTALSIYNENL